MDQETSAENNPYATPSKQAGESVAPVVCQFVLEGEMVFSQGLAARLRFMTITGMILYATVLGVSGYAIYHLVRGIFGDAIALFVGMMFGIFCLSSLIAWLTQILIIWRWMACPTVPLSTSITGDEKGFVISTPFFEQHGRWALVKKPVRFQTDLLWIGPTQMSDQGFTVRKRRFEGTMTEQSFEDSVAKNVRTDSKIAIASELMPAADFRSIDLGDTAIRGSGFVRYADVCDRSRWLWRTRMLHFFVSFVVLLILPVSLIGWFAFSFQSSTPDDFWLIALFAVSFLLTSLRFYVSRMRQFVRLVQAFLNPSLIVSKLEIRMTRIGWEVRTNSSQVRILWSAYENASLKNNAVVATLTYTGQTSPIFRRYGYNDAQWAELSAYAIERINHPLPNSTV